MLELSQLSDEFLEPGWLPLGLLIKLESDGSLEVLNSEEEVPQTLEEGWVHYELVANVAHIRDAKSSGNLISQVKVGETYHQRKENVTCSQCYLFNDFSITPIEKVSPRKLLFLFPKGRIQRRGGGGGFLGVRIPPPPPHFRGPPNFIKRGKNVACVRMKTPRFSTKQLPRPPPPPPFPKSCICPCPLYFINVYSIIHFKSFLVGLLCGSIVSIDYIYLILDIEKPCTLMENFF